MPRRIIKSKTPMFTKSDEIIPERAEVYDINKKYLSDVKVYIRRTSRKSPYYFNVEGKTLEYVGSNVSLHGVYYEYLHNEYKRSFVEVDMNLCEIVIKEPWLSLLGRTLQERGFICPVPPVGSIRQAKHRENFYKFHNMTVSMRNFPYVWPFEKAMIQGYAKMAPTQEIIVRARFYVLFKHDVPKGK